MRLINPELVPVARSLIASQGGSPYLLNDDGSLSPDATLALFYNEVEVRTSVTPPLRFPIGPTGTPADPTTDALVRQLKPTVILRGPAGEVTVAPYGTEVATSWWPVILAGGATVLLAGWLVFGGRR